MKTTLFDLNIVSLCQYFVSCSLMSIQQILQTGDVKVSHYYNLRESLINFYNQIGPSTGVLQIQKNLRKSRENIDSCSSDFIHCVKNRNFT